MNKLYIITAFISLVAFSSCQDKLDVDALTDFPPSILSVSPKTSVKIGEFKIKVALGDGASSPLASGTVTLKDADGNELFSKTETLTGVLDSIIAEAVDFDAASLDYGTYTLVVNATDTHDQTTESITTFDIVDQLYPANNSAMFIAGEFNGWGAGELVLIAANTWEIKNVDLNGGKFKFKNTTDWSDADWGDSDCDGLMAVTTGGGPDTNCGYSGPVNIQFNDETLKYTVKSAVTFKSNLAGLFLLGNINEFQGTQYAFKLISDHNWELTEVRLKSGDAFKFAESPEFEGENYGDSNFDGKAEAFGPNIVLPNTVADAFYKITFNDVNLRYELILVRYPYPDQLYLVGGASSAGWNPGSSIPFVKTGDGKFEIYAYLTADGFKFLQVQDWAGDWGMKPGNSGVLEQEGEDNVSVATAGFYRIQCDFIAKTYSVQLMNWGIIGDATPGGWGSDTDMIFSGGSGTYTWSIDVDLAATGKFKFRANDGWDVNFGDNGGDTTLEYGGSDIPTPGAGNYHIEMILNPVSGFKYTITLN
ncbi:MAG: SusF/SusE family outer membrane protein [Chryseolinea sp.]